MVRAESGPAAVLHALGLQPTEAEVYVTLLALGPSTGYAVAQRMDRSPPAVYNALDALLRRGAVAAEDAQPRFWTAVPPDEFLAALRSDFVRHAEHAHAALAPLASPVAASAGVSVLRAPVQALRATRRLIAGSRDVLLADLGPTFVDLLREDLEAAAARGVAVTVKVYRAAEVAGCRVSLASVAHEVVGDLPCQALVCVADADQFVSALFDRSGTRLLTGLQTANAFLTGLRHSGLVCEVHWDQLARAVEAAVSPEDLAALKRLLADQRREGWRHTAAFARLMASAPAEME